MHALHFFTRLFILLLICTLALPVHAHTVNPEIIERITGEPVPDDYLHTHASNTDGDPRAQSRTFYSFPEWYIVYSAQEYGEHVTEGRWPSQFPWFSAIGQLWDAWEFSETAAASEPDSTTNTILWTISISTTIEYGLIGLYEFTIGHLSEILNFRIKTVEDTYTEQIALEYGTFLNQTPWYQFPYGQALKGLWSTYSWSSLSPRGLERRIAFTIGYSVKALYAMAIRLASQSSFGEANLTTTAEVFGSSEQLGSANTSSTPPDSSSLRIIELPRYRAFLPEAEMLARNGVEFISIQGHDMIAVSIVAESGLRCVTESTFVSYQMPILTQTPLVRYVLAVPVPELASLLRTLTKCGVSVEHIYDY